MKERLLEYLRKHGEVYVGAIEDANELEASSDVSSAEKEELEGLRTEVRQLREIVEKGPQA